MVTDFLNGEIADHVPEDMSRGDGCEAVAFMPALITPLVPFMILYAMTYFP